MAEVASAFVSLLPSAKGFGRKLEGEVGGELGGVGKRLGGKLGAALKIGAAAAAAGAFMFAKDAVGEAREAQKVGALTTSIIKSTGGAAKVSAKQVGDLATAISNKTGMDDEAVQSGANMLLTFKEVKNELGKGNQVFDRATQAAADLSAAGFGDLSGQAKMLGKALNDPVKGMSAMARSGVTFTDAQKKQVESLVATGDTLGAQKIILEEVESQVGGAAAASSTAGEKAAVAWGNLKEQVGTAMLPAIDAAATAFTTHLAPAISSAIDGVGPAFGKVKGFLAPVPGYVTKVWDAFNGGGKTVSAIKKTLESVGRTLDVAFGGGGGGGVSSAVASFKSFGDTIASNVLPFAQRAGEVFRNDILPAVEKVAGSFITNFVPVLQAAAGTFKTVVLPAILGVGQYLIANLWPILKKVWSIVATQVIPIISSLAQWFYGTLYPTVMSLVVAIGSKLKPVFDAIFRAILTNVLPAVQRLLAKFKEWLPTIQMVIGVVIKVVGAILKFAAAILAKVLPPIIKFAGWLIGALVGALTTVIGWVIKIIGWVVRFGVAIVNGVKKVAEFVSGLKEKFGEAVDYVKDIPGRIVTALGNLATLLVDKGKDIVTGLWEGIKSMGSWLSDKLISFAKEIIPGPIAKALGIDSPSKVMAEQARWIPIGMAEGIESEASRVQGAMDRIGRGVNVPRITPDVTHASSGRGGLGGRLQLVLSDGRALDAYVRDVADGSVADAGAFARTMRRMH